MYDFCLPTKSTTVPSGPDWLHEIKYDGYRLRLERNGDRVRLITRGGYDWTKRFPSIVEAAHKIRQKQFVLDGEAVVPGVDGMSDFHALHSGKHNKEVQLCAFDILVEGDDDLRQLPLSMRKTNLERLLTRRREGIFVNPFERGEVGPDLFRAAARGVPRTSVSELRLGPWGKVGQSRVLALGCELAAIFLDLRRLRIKQLGLRLRVADGLSQHLAQLGLSLCRLTRRRFPSGRMGLHLKPLGAKSNASTQP
jgi:bifunctional non-homologous end joining protein LigD